MTKDIGDSYQWGSGLRVLTAAVQAVSGLALPFRDQSGTQRLVIGSSGVHLGSGSVINGGGVQVVGLPNATTVPTTNPTGGAVLYSEGGVLKVRQSDGTVVTVANAPTSSGPVGSSRSSATASFTTTVTTVISHTPAAGEIVAGTTYYYRAALRVINTITATNLTVSLAVGVTSVTFITQALGTTANATPGRPVLIEGTVTFYSTTSAEASMRIFASGPVAFDTLASTSASVAVTAGSAINLNVNSSGATSSVIAREAAIWKVR